MRTLALFTLLALTACSGAAAQALPSSTPTPEPCPVQAAGFVEQSMALLQEWDDANTIAESTARISLAGPVSDLQRIRRQYEALDAPECARSAQAAMVAYMDKDIESLLAFMADEPDGVIGSKIRVADRLFRTAVTEFVALKP